MQLTTRPAQRPSRVRLRRFCFTLNNWSDDEYKSITEYPCSWMIVGKEVGKEGTPHLQGACVLGKQIDFNTLKRHPGFKRCHIETMKGSVEDNINYCSKEDSSPFVAGTPPKPGKRNDIDNLVDLMREGKTVVDLIRDDQLSISPIIRYPKGFSLVSNTLHRPKRTGPPTVIWVYGSTGTYKTRCVCEFADALGEYWISAGDLRWFDGYTGQPTVIFDDLRTRHAKFDVLLRLLDRYPFRVEFKGGFTDWIPKLILVTAPKSPRDMWNLRTDEDIRQLERRITKVLCSDKYSYDQLVSKLRTVKGASSSGSSPMSREVVDLTTKEILPEDPPGSITRSLYDHANKL